MTTIQTDQAAPATPKTEAWLIERYDANDKLVRSVVLAPLTDDVFLDESSEAIALCRVEAAAPQQAVAASSEPVPNLEIRLSEPHARALRDAIGDGCTQAVTLKVGDGHSGFGLYVWATEYPDDGAWLIKNLPPLSTNQPVQAKALTDERAEFEKLCVRKGYNTNKWHGDGSIYVDGYTLSGWEAWQARALLASQPSCLPDSVGSERLDGLIAKSDDQPSANLVPSLMRVPSAQPTGWVSESRSDALCDMHYTRGLEQGFMSGERGDYDGFLKTQKSREGYIATLKATRGESAQADLAAVRDAALEEVLTALGDLSFECFSDIGTQRPSVETYNRTFSVLEKYRVLKSAAPTAQPQADGVKP